ncbi:MAG: Gfo/Idh/MocA family oxidoreductase [Ginsengibacter sp.]
MSENYSRRTFFQQLGGTGLVLAAGAFSSSAAKEDFLLPKKVKANEHIRIALIGAGIMGNADLETALKVPGISLAAVCDLYSGRLTRVKEKYGKDVYTTMDYREILEKKEIDVVIIATTDIWHARIARDAMQKGKDVYCEKPMVKEIHEGLPLIAVQKQTKRVFQVGSQVIAGFSYHKAKELLKNGEIGKLNCIEATYDRHSSLGAWEYTMPSDISPETVDWDRYIAGIPKQPFDANKFFRWRCYKEFGTGVAGDLFVHLLTGIHMIVGSRGPSRIFSMGQLSHWKDGRNVPDVMTAIMEYPETKEHPKFLLTLRVNFASGAGEQTQIRFIGDEGVMNLGSSDVSVQYNLLPKAPGMADGWDAITTYPIEMQKSLLEDYNNKYSKEEREAPVKDSISFSAPAGQDKHLNHFNQFFDSVRNGSPVFEDAEFGFRAAAPCLACNDSYFQNRSVHWDPLQMKEITSPGKK